MEDFQTHLRFSAEHFESAFQYSGIGMAIVSPEGKWLKVNKQVEQIVGYPEEELLKKTFQDITHPEDLEADLDQVKQMLNKEIETYQMKKRYFHKDGHTVWVRLTVSLVWKQDGTPDFFISQIEDISNEVAAKEHIQYISDRQTRILDAMVSGLYIYDVATKQNEYINKRYTAITGWTLAEVQAMGDDFINMFHPDDLALVQTHMKELLHAKEDSEVMLEHRIKKKNGEWMWALSLDTQFERDTEGNVTKLIGSFIDITEKRNADLQKTEELANVSKMNKVMIGRESRMIELKQEVDALLQELGRPVKYQKGKHQGNSSR